MALRLRALPVLPDVQNVVPSTHINIQLLTPGPGNLTSYSGPHGYVGPQLQRHTDTHTHTRTPMNKSF